MRMRMMTITAAQLPATAATGFKLGPPLSPVVSKCLSCPCTQPLSQWRWDAETGSPTAEKQSSNAQTYLGVQICYSLPGSHYHRGMRTDGKSPQRGRSTYRCQSQLGSLQKG